MNPPENQALQPMPLSLLFLKSIVAGMGIVLVLGFTLVIAMILLGMKYFTDVRSCDKHPSGDIMLAIPPDVTINRLDVDCGIVKAYANNNKLYGFDSETGHLKFTIHTQ